jgi:hypothetical protein
MNVNEVARTIITHVGTSIFDCLAAESWERAKLNELKRHIDAASPSVRPSGSGSLEPLYAEAGSFLGERLRSYWDNYPNDPDTVQSAVNGKQRRRFAPAEIASLDLIGVETADRVVLACSDTEHGMAAGHLLYYTLRAFAPSVATNGISLCRLEGVDAEDGTRFAESGLPNYIKMIGAEARQLRQRRGPQRSLICNVTGGYKGVVPFATLAAQLIGTHPGLGLTTSVVYAHDEGDALIMLVPTLPVDWAQLDNYIADLRAMVKRPESSEGRAALHNRELVSYRERGVESEQPNTLARLLVALYDALEL